MSLAPIASWAGTELDSHPDVYLNKKLSFRYMVPLGMKDDTEAARAQIRVEAAKRHDKNSLTILLALTNGMDEGSPSSQSFTIQTYRRSAIQGSDDSIAEEKMNAWVLGLGRAKVPARHFVLAGQDFAVSVAASREGKISRGAVVWTTVRKGHLLSFAFVANSPDQLQKLTETMKMVQFY
jgi:hypothetical protein